MLERLRQFIPIRRLPPRPERLRLHEDGFALTDGYGRQESWRILWSEIEEVYAYRAMSLGGDITCLAIRVRDRLDFYRVNHDMVGYRRFIAALESRLPQIDPDWWPKLAFAPDPTLMIRLYPPARAAASSSVHQPATADAR